MDSSELEVRSAVSHSSRSSAVSSATLAAATACAKAQAAQTRATFLKKEIEIKMEKACIEATIDALEREGEAQATEAEADEAEQQIVGAF